MYTVGNRLGLNGRSAIRSSDARLETRRADDVVSLYYDKDDGRPSILIFLVILVTTGIMEIPHHILLCWKIRNRTVRDRVFAVYYVYV